MVVVSVEKSCGGRGGGLGSIMSSILSSAWRPAFSCTVCVLSSLTILTASWVRSRMIDSTSLPTYPTSVNLEASTFIKGACESLANRRDISVLPTPVGPIIMMFFGMTSSRRSPESLCRRQHALSAIATARLALACPMTYLSSSSTICLGVKKSLTCYSYKGFEVFLEFHLTPRPLDPLNPLSQFFYRDLTVGIDADPCCYLHGFFRNPLCAHFRVPDKGPCRRKGIRTA